MKDDKLKKGLELAGTEAYKNLAAVNRISTLLGKMKDALSEIESNEMESINQSANHILDILTVLENHVFLASTDSAFLIELFELTDDIMLGEVLTRIAPEAVVKMQKVLLGVATSNMLEMVLKESSDISIALWADMIAVEIERRKDGS